MSAIVLAIRLICGLNSLAGRFFSWFALAIVLVCFTVVVLRYVFAVSFVWMQDLYVWLNGAMFTAVAGFALLRDDHVRVDIYYREASHERKAIADAVGAVLFLLPFSLVVFVYALPFVERSWSVLEASGSVGGLQGLFVLKSFILLFAVLLALQGLVLMLRSFLVLSGHADLVPDPVKYAQPKPEMSAGGEERDR